MIRNFWKGFTAPIRAGKLIFRHPKLFTLSLIPLTISIALYVLFFYTVSDWLGLQSKELLTRYAADLAPWLQTAVKTSFWIITWVFLCVTAAISFTFVSTIVASPFNDFLSRHTVKVLRDPLHLSPGIISASIPQTLKLELKRTFVLVVGGIAALVIGIIPLLQLPALAFAAAVVSFEFFGYPISQQTSSLRPVFAFVLRNLWVSVGFGAFLLLMMALPFTTVIYLPLAVVGASMLYSELGDS